LIPSRSKGPGSFTFIGRSPSSLERILGTCATAPAASQAPDHGTAQGAATPSDAAVPHRKTVYAPPLEPPTGSSIPARVFCAGGALLIPGF